MGAASTASPSVDQMATGRRPTMSDSRPRITAIAAMTSNVAAEINNVDSRVELPRGCHVVGHEDEESVEPNAPAAINAKPLIKATRFSSQRVGMGRLMI